MNVRILSNTLSEPQLAAVEKIVAECAVLPPEKAGPLLLSIAVVCAQECGMARAAFLDAAADTFDKTRLLED